MKLKGNIEGKRTEGTENEKDNGTGKLGTWIL